MRWLGSSIHHSFDTGEHHANVALRTQGREYQSAIDDPATVVLVAEDEWDPAEGECAYESLRKSPMYSHGTDTRVRIIVGVCSINLKPGSAYVGLFQAGCKRVSPLKTSLGRGTDYVKAHVGKSGVHAALGEVNRDQSAEAVQRYAEATAPAKTK